MNTDLFRNAPSSGYPQAFAVALARVFADEGGYSDQRNDPGGATKYGISQHQYPTLDIAKLTRDEAATIYYRDWWQRFDFGSLPDTVGGKLFNLAINIGPREASLCLQRALRACGHRVAEDGALGDQSRAAAQSADPAALAAALRSEAAGHYRVLAVSDARRKVFLEGWLNRAYE
ncbi:MAG: hypothetical protein IVW54_09445 [Candidatus Binataceae bacterium]|nr:hypothetical protein [Candidatus Binataceae bacterium]